MEKFTYASNSANGFSLAYLDISDLVEDALTTTIEVDLYVPTDSRTILSLCDATTRGTAGGSSAKNAYASDGVAFYVGEYQAARISVESMRLLIAICLRMSCVTSGFM